MEPKMLNMDWDLRWKIEELERRASHVSVFVREDEPYFQEIKDLIQKKRQERIDELKKQMEK